MEKVREDILQSSMRLSRLAMENQSSGHDFFPLFYGWTRLLIAQLLDTCLLSLCGSKIYYVYRRFGTYLGILGMGRWYYKILRTSDTIV
jgi:hypothetical protein